VRETRKLEENSEWANEVRPYRKHEKSIEENGEPAMTSVGAAGR